MPHFRSDEARTIIREAYGRVSSESRAIAEAYYSTDELERLPREAVELALGVANPLRHAAVRAGETVLDLGCGAGIDTLLAAQAVGSSGRAIGLDMTSEMADRARRNAVEARLDNVEIREGFMEEIPLPDASVDVVVSNGVLNLSTRKSRVLAETMRVLRPGGRVSIADLVLDQTLPEEVLKSPAALAGWLAGALAEPALLKKFFNVGFEEIDVVERETRGLDDMARYPLFAPDFIDFLRRTIPSRRHRELVFSIVVTARRGDLLPLVSG